MNIIKKKYTVEDFLKKYVQPGAKILNAGCGETRYGENCTNVDVVARSGVDVVCNIENLEFVGVFDTVICNATLQYCRYPRLAAKNLFYALKPGGLIFVDAPWVQGYCANTPDRFRFSQDALKDMFSDFEILACGASIPPGSAFVFLGIKIAGSMTRNKYINFALAKIATALLWPLRGIKTANQAACAGAFYLIGRKTT